MTNAVLYKIKFGHGMQFVNSGSKVQISLFLVRFIAISVVCANGPIIKPELKRIPVISRIPKKNT